MKPATCCITQLDSVRLYCFFYVLFSPFCTKQNFLFQIAMCLALLLTDFMAVSARNIFCAHWVAVLPCTVFVCLAIGSFMLSCHCQSICLLELVEIRLSAFILQLFSALKFPYVIQLSATGAVHDNTGEGKYSELVRVYFIAVNFECWQLSFCACLESLGGHGALQISSFKSPLFAGTKRMLNAWNTARLVYL